MDHLIRCKASVGPDGVSHTQRILLRSVYILNLPTRPLFVGGTPGLNTVFANLKAIVNIFTRPKIVI